MTVFEVAADGIGSDRGECEKMAGMKPLKEELETTTSVTMRRKPQTPTFQRAGARTLEWTGSSAAWQRTAFGTLGSKVQILSPRLIIGLCAGIA